MEKWGKLAIREGEGWTLKDHQAGRSQIPYENRRRIKSWLLVQNKTRIQEKQLVIIISYCKYEEEFDSKIPGEYNTLGTTYITKFIALTSRLGLYD